tara:strand:+ start:159 stop:740 length:582 start_codon:yes stop_codon:yes gene_type:complete
MVYKDKETDAYFANGDPKFPFVGKVVEVYYINNELTALEIVYNYTVPDDGETVIDGGVHENGGEELQTTYHISPVEPDDARMKALLEEFPWESIDECTRAKLEVDRQVFRDAFHRYAKENNLYQETTEESQGSLDILFDFDAENADHKEVLFKLKLKIFEQESVKNSKKRKAKTEIRKAENPVEAIKAYSTLL